MIDKAQLFNQTMGRLANIYKDSPAQLEAMNAAASVCKALMEDTAYDTDIKTKPKAASELQQKPQEVKAGAETGSPAKSPAVVNSSRVKGAETTIVKAARIDPVQIKKWSDNDLDTAIRDGAVKKYSNFTDDPMKMLDDEVSGKLGKDVEKLDAKIAKNEEKRQKKEGKQFVKNMEKLDSLKRDTNDYDRKAAEADEKVAARKAEDDELTAVADQLKAAGKDKAAELVKQGMNTGIGRKLTDLKDKAKSKLFGWLKNKSKAAQDKLDDAINKKDTTGITDAVNDLKDVQMICEAVGIDIDSLLG